MGKLSAIGKITSRMKRLIREEMFEKDGIGNMPERNTGGLFNSRLRTDEEMKKIKRKKDARNRKNISSASKELIKHQGKKRTGKFLRSVRDENFRPKGK